MTTMLLNQRGATYGATVEMALEQCCECGMPFGMPVDFKNDRLKRRRIDMTFYCPRGHGQHYTGESEAQKLRRELEETKRSLGWARESRATAERRADHEAARARGYKGHAAKLSKRIRAGTCPCCDRRFADLEQHMAAEHPTFGELAEATSQS